MGDSTNPAAAEARTSAVRYSARRRKCGTDVQLSSKFPAKIVVDVGDNVLEELKEES
jgi:hypothetical protein